MKEATRWCREKNWICKNNFNWCKKQWQWSTKTSCWKLLFLGHRSWSKNKTQEALINLFDFRIFINLTFHILFKIHFQKWSKWPLKIMTRLYIQKGVWNWWDEEFTILNSNQYKRQQLIKQQLLFTQQAADIDIKSWLKALYKQCFSYRTMIICFARC